MLLWVLLNMNKKIKVFHVEDYKIMRDGIRHLLNLDDEIEIVGEAKNGEELLNALDQVHIDVLILDIYLDAMEDLKILNGFQICRLIQQKYPQIKIVAHSVYDDADRVALIIKSGALGFVSKKAGFEELVLAIKVVNQGKKFICSETSSRLKNLNQFLLGLENNLRSKGEIFSQREREVLNLLSEGRSSKEIADQLFITERTVETHRKNMLEKSNVKNTVELVAYASAIGVIKK
ncbi:response regulator transcription factor [Chryseolinea sp. H1M3-3]|uniref:LuxR C-terminal-related transcriptional regulator n=1 Tax=Chryseolinea sp. H1M3-3 TaxID=3034144 RepID=UPI0023EB9980|nr:response regulator transcription factor [Chryseolinea sp. H1M3-3]